MLENKREVYKFWLGFLEKVFLLAFASLFIPMFSGKLDLSTKAIILWLVICFLLFVAMFDISLRLWKL